MWSSTSRQPRQSCVASCQPCRCSRRGRIGEGARAQRSKDRLSMKKLLACSALLATSLAGVAATGGLALADENGKLYPAFGCLETGTGGGTTINRNEVRITKSSGGVDETAFVLCPIIRDERS